MKTFTAALAAALLAGGLGTAAIAAENHEPGTPTGAGSAPPATTGATTGSPTLGSPGLSGGPAAEQMAAQHTMAGTVAKLNQPAGTLTVKTADGQRLSLHFPPSALTEYKVGDRVTVQLGLTKLSAAGATGSTGTAPGAAGAMSGSGGTRPSGSTDAPDEQ